jgi:hypothetical protein
MYLMYLESIVELQRESCVAVPAGHSPHYSGGGPRSPQAVSHLAALPPPLPYGDPSKDEQHHVSDPLWVLSIISRLSVRCRISTAVRSNHWALPFTAQAVLQVCYRCLCLL